jgi:hypothetical protein
MEGKRAPNLEPMSGIVDWHWVQLYPKAAAALLDVLREDNRKLRMDNANMRVLLGLPATQVQPSVDVEVNSEEPKH